MIVITRVSLKAELEAISRLQHANLKKNISPEEAEGQGFLTAEYSLQILEEMHSQEPAIIAMDGDKLAGYALVTTKAVRHCHPLVTELFNAIDLLEYKQVALKQINYVVVGQLCVNKVYRGKGIVSQLYNHFRDSLAEKYPYCLTDVATANQRSLKAHKHAGFEVINHLEYGGLGWEIVLWDWRQK